MDSMPKFLKITNKTRLVLNRSSKTVGVAHDDDTECETESTELTTEKNTENIDIIDYEEIYNCVDIEHRAEALDLKHAEENIGTNADVGSDSNSDTESATEEVTNALAIELNRELQPSQ